MTELSLERKIKLLKALAKVVASNLTGTGGRPQTPSSDKVVTKANEKIMQILNTFDEKPGGL